MSDFQDIKEYWNSKPSLSNIIAITSKRRNKLNARLEEPEFYQNWVLIIDIIADSPFCCGYNDRGWKASFDWIITNDNNYIKVLEGKYTITAPKPVSSAPTMTAQWENRIGDFIRDTDAKELKSHPSLEHHWSNPEFVKWAEGVKPELKGM